MSNYYRITGMKLPEHPLNEPDGQWPDPKQDYINRVKDKETLAQSLEALYQNPFRCYDEVDSIQGQSQQAHKGTGYVMGDDEYPMQEKLRLPPGVEPLDSNNDQSNDTQDKTNENMQKEPDNNNKNLNLDDYKIQIGFSTNDNNL